MVRSFVTPRATGGAGGRENARWPEPGAAVQHGRHKSRLAVAGAGVCRRCDAVGALKTAEVAGARGCSAAEYCTEAEECVEESTAPVRRRGLSYRGEARGGVL